MPVSVTSARFARMDRTAHPAGDALKPPPSVMRMRPGGDFVSNVRSSDTRAGGGGGAGMPKRFAGITPIISVVGSDDRAGGLLTVPPRRIHRFAPPRRPPPRHPPGPPNDGVADSGRAP